MSTHIAYALNAFLLSVLLIQLLRKHATRLGLVDQPTQRKQHEGVVPVVGGIAIFGGFLLPFLLSGGPAATPWNLVAGLAALTATGVIDDHQDMRPRVKLLCQTAAALVLIVPGNHLVQVAGRPFGLDLAVVALPFTLLFLVGMINAFNMLDGLDGLAGGVALCAFAWMVLVAALTGRTGDMGVLLLLVSATIGFLVFNVRHPWQRRAAVFMGDAGSMMLGAAVAVFTIRTTGEGAGPVPFLAVLWLMAVPAIDTLSVMVRRMAIGRSPFAADRRHLHHLLLDGGLTPGLASAVIVSLSFVLGGAGLGLAAAGAPTGVYLAGLAGVAAAHTGFVLSRRRPLAVAAPIAATMPSTLPS